MAAAVAPRLKKVARQLFPLVFVSPASSRASSSSSFLFLLLSPGGIKLGKRARRERKRSLVYFIKKLPNEMKGASPNEKSANKTVLALISICAFETRARPIYVLPIGIC